MILIHARNLTVANGTAMRLGLKVDQWRYIMYESDMRGRQCLPMLVTADAHLNKDHVGIMETARFQDFWIWREK